MNWAYDFIELFSRNPEHRGVPKARNPLPPPPSKEKPRFRIQWDYNGGSVIGYWLWTCNLEATKLQQSKYYHL